MNLLDQKTIGMIMLLLLGMLVVIKRIATGSAIDAPKGSFPVRLINAFNLFFLLIIIPGTSLLLITGHLEAVDPARITFFDPYLLPVISLSGLITYIAGHLLMCYALICMGRNYQIGGTPPRAEDKIMTNGPFRAVRHPVYTAALCIALGLFILTQSWVLFGLLGVYCVLILILIGIEEEDLLLTYREQYSAYREKVKKLIPFIY